MVIEFVIKRNSGKEKFHPEKVRAAVWKAVESVNGKNKDKFEVLFNQIIKNINKCEKNEVSVEEIQDIIEKTLIKRGHDMVAKSFILYRHNHDMLRNFKSIVEDTEVIDNYIGEMDWKIKENSNMTYSLQGLNNHVAQKVTGTYWLTKVFPPEISKLHYEGDLHIHDLGSLSVYCLGWDLKDLLLNGFGGVVSKIESGPPKHFRSALGQIVNFLYTLQGESAGAQAFSNFDTYLAPYIREDNLTRKEVKQTLQEFMYNMNVPTRTGFQTPFTNITLDLKVPGHMANLPVIIGGKILNVSYKDYQEEMNLFNDVLFEIYMEGDKKGKVFTFPIPTINIGKDFDWNNPNHEKIWAATAKYGIPYFGNYVNSDMNPEDTTSMCCRLRIDETVLHKRGGGIFASHPLTGSVGIVTINMPRIGYLANSETEFIRKLDMLMDASAKTLRLKRKFIEKWTTAGFYPYSKYYLRHTKEATGEYWHNHFNTIGINGMNECCLNFLKKDITTKEGLEFSIKIMNHMKDRLQKYKEEDGQEYNLEATPAEGATRRFANVDKAKFNDIIVANEKNLKDGATPYYTNSSHVNVNSKLNLFEVLDNQNKLQTIYTGGSVLHIFLGEHGADPKSVKALVKKIFTKYSLPYISITPTFSICPIHSYIPGKHKYCPLCLTHEDIIPAN